MAPSVILNAIVVTPELMADNQASWTDMFAFVDEFPENDTWKEWKKFMRTLLRAGVEDKLDKYFHAGQSMQHIIFSTCERHGLERYDPQPPRVTVGRDEGGYFVAYSRSNLWFNPPDRKDTITSSNALAVLRSYLLILWQETRPTDQVPPVFGSKSR